MAYGKIKADSIIYDNSGSDVEKTLASLAAAAPTANPTLTGTVTVPTATAGDNTTKAASTAFVTTSFAPKASPTFTGTVNAAALTLSGNLQVNGTTTTVASSTMTVTDKNIEIAKGAANDAAADGAGITIDSGDGDKTWNWVDATDAWTSSEHIHLGDGKKLLLGTGSDLEIYSGGTGGKLHCNTGILELEGDSVQIWNHAANEALAKFTADGSCELYHNNVKKLETSAAGVTVTGTVSCENLVDGKGNVRTIPQVVSSSQHTIVSNNEGKHITNTTGGWIFNTSSGFTAGQAVTLINNSGSDQTITATGVTLYNTADASTGNRTLAQRGMATVLCTASNTYYISGAGLS